MRRNNPALQVSAGATLRGLRGAYALRPLHPLNESPALTLERRLIPFGAVLGFDSGLYLRLI